MRCSEGDIPSSSEFDPRPGQATAPLAKDCSKVGKRKDRLLMPPSALLRSPTKETRRKGKEEKGVNCHTASQVSGAAPYVGRDDPAFGGLRLLLTTQPLEVWSLVLTPPHTTHFTHRTHNFNHLQIPASPRFEAIG